MDMELNDDQIAFAQAAKEFALGELAPHAARWDQESIFPIETIKLAGRMGFGAMYASPEIGGLGLPRLDATLVFEEMAAIDPSTTWQRGWWASGPPRRCASSGASLLLQATNSPRIA